MRRFASILAPLFLCGVLLQASSSHYVIQFTAEAGVAPASGSFDYDSSRPVGSQFTNFVVSWAGVRLDFTSTANLLICGSGKDCPSSCTPSTSSAPCQPKDLGFSSGTWDFQCAAIGGPPACLGDLTYITPSGAKRPIPAMIRVDSTKDPSRGAWRIE